MSLKLGDTDIAGTQVLYSTTGSNTDGAMTQAATTTALGLKANDADVIHKTGDENYTGIKTYQINDVDTSVTQWLDAHRIHLMQYDVTNIINPITVYYDVLKDNNGNYLMYNALNVGSDGTVSNSLTARTRNSANTDNVSAQISIIVRRNGTILTSCPASDINGSILTTVNKSKSSNGYLQLGNGIIIQWGFYENTGSQANKTLNLNKAFSNTNYKITMTQEYDSSSTYEANAYIQSKTTTTVTFRCPSGGVEWIAIGY